MSAKNSNTTSDYIEWDVVINLIYKLYRDGDFRMSLLVGCGIFFVHGECANENGEMALEMLTELFNLGLRREEILRAMIC